MPSLSVCGIHSRKSLQSPGGSLELSGKRPGVGAGGAGSCHTEGSLVFQASLEMP